MRIAVFVEDAAHEALVVGLLKRTLQEMNAEATVEVRSAVGGRGAVLTSFRRYARDVAQGTEAFAEILVAAIDGNCHGRHSVVSQIEDRAHQSEYAGRVVGAVPDPHVEAWYLSDGKAVFAALGAAGPQPALPAAKCERSRYKTLLREAFLAGGVDPPAGGSEYGEDVAGALDLVFAEKQSDDLAAFMSDLRSAVREAQHAP